MKIVLQASLGRAQVEKRLREIAGSSLVYADDAAALARELADADALVYSDLAYNAQAAEAVKNGAPNLRFIQLLTAGYDNIARLGARPDIKVANAGAAFSLPVATHAIALLFALQRRLPDAIANRPKHAWERGYAAQASIPAGGAIAIVGFGPIGREIARLLKPFGAHIIAVTRSGKADALADECVAVANLRAVLPRADAIVLALPLDESSRHLLGAAEFALCKKTALIVNIARGGVTDQLALKAALESGQIAGAGVDVAEPEPLPAAHPLWDAPNLILTPHYAGACGPVAGERMADVVGANVLRFIKGEKLQHLVAL